MSTVVLCLSCGAVLPEDASLCECDQEEREFRIRARHLVTRPSEPPAPLSRFREVLCSVVALAPRTDDDFRLAMLAASTAHREPAS